MNADQAAALRKPFDKNQIGKLPKGGAMLDFVGHAAITDRLLSVDSGWTWEPVAFGPDGLPKLDEFGGLWIRLTVCDVTRLGYGDADGKKGNNAVKIAIGDALRNAALRFGVAIDLWSKQDLDAAPDNGSSNGHSQAPPQSMEVGVLRARIAKAGQRLNMSRDDLEADFAYINNGETIPTASAELLETYAKGLEAKQVSV